MFLVGIEIKHWPEISSKNLKLEALEMNVTEACMWKTFQVPFCLSHASWLIGIFYFKVYDKLIY